MTGAQAFLTTERLELWKPVASDIAEMFAIMQNPVTGRFLGNTSDPAEHFTRFQRNAGSWPIFGYGMLMLREKGRARLLGNCGIFHSWRGLGEDFDNRAEAGWILAAEAAGKGYASEAMRAVYDWFDAEHGLATVCMIAPENAGSINVAHKLGFAETRQTTLADGGDVVLFERSAPE